MNTANAVGKLNVIIKDSQKDKHGIQSINL